jgi:hypothetical protein
MSSASVVLTGDSGGSVTVTVPSGTSIGTTTLILPTTGGTLQTSGSGFTTNGVAYASSTSALTTGSALTFDGTNLGLSGIGPRFINLGSTSTNGQTVALQISAPNSDASANVYRVGTGLTADNEWTVYDVTSTQTVDKYIRGSSGYRALFVNGSEQMRLNSTGLGIGTSSPAAKLDVQSTGAVIQLKQNSTGAATYYVMDNTIETGGKRWRFGYTGAAGIPCFSLYNQTDNVLSLVADAAGNLGLGVTPSAWSGITAFQSLRASFVGLGNNGYFGSNWYFDGTNNRYIASAAASRIDFTAGGMQFQVAPSGTAGNSISFTQAMSLDVSGNLLIGYTSSNGSYKLQVNSQIFATSAIIATSDARYKTNVTPILNGLALVNKLNPVSFDWKEHSVHNFDTKNTNVGFLAQDVQEVLKDEIYLNSVIRKNETELPDGTKEQFLGLSDSSLIPILVKAIQEQQSIIESITTRLTALESK